MTPIDHLTHRQRELLDAWLPGHVVVADHSWGLVSTRVLEVEHGGRRFIVKAAADDDTHLPREVRAHREWLGPWTRIGRAPLLQHDDIAARILVTGCLPGVLVAGHDAQDDADTYRQAGALLALLHAQASTEDDTYESHERRRSLAFLDEPHRIAPDVEARLRDEIASWPTTATTVVPTHGDWQPRNWLVHDGVVSVIDFGRAALRPAATDLTRLVAQDFRRDPALETAFLTGYGGDPRDPQAWRRLRLREAIGTAVWAYRIGDGPFEAQGHRMIADALR